MINQFIQEAEYLIRARYSILYINTAEEERAIEVFEQIAKRLNKRIVTWTVTDGLICDGRKLDPNSCDFMKAIEIAEDMAKEPTLFLWLDLHPYISGMPVHVRMLREFSQKIRYGFPSNSIIISPVVDIPVELQKETTILDLPLPDLKEVCRIINQFNQQYSGREGLSIDNSPQLIETLARAAVGLTRSEIENALSKALVQDHSISIDDVNIILDEKKQIIRKSGILEYISTETMQLDDVGGLENLKRWLIKRKASYSQDARNFGIPWPKGVLLAGVPGCGKSLCAKSIATAWGMPLLRLDLGRVYGSLVGASESNIRAALNMCEAVSPSIVWIDEIEKGLAGSTSGHLDSGVGARVLSTLLTWMQEKKSPVFVFATANNIEHLPPELLRKGRFDEIFFVDLPNAAERREIFKIHIERSNRPLEQFDLDMLVQVSGEAHWGDQIRLTGSEIEAAVQEALLEAFNERMETNNRQRDLQTEDIIQAVKRTVPIAKSRPQQIDKLRGWASENAVRASLYHHSPVGTEEKQPVGRNIDF